VGTSALAAEETAKTATPAKSRATVGNPLAPWLIEQMVKEINGGLKERSIEDRFAAFQKYAGEQLDGTAGKAQTSEVTGNCRLKWYDHLMRNPLKAPVVAGDDVYDARDIAQGSAVGGVGILIDFAGNDRYRGFRRVQGQAIGGLGILLDRAGKDDYHAAMWAQGFGGPLGFGVLDDLEGDDHYYCGGQWRDSYYPETPGYECWGQGVGAGLRGVADGGIGVILDGAGNDVYEYDYFAQGGGYWLGMGFARDFGGNDQRIGSTRQEYDGSPRTQSVFGRFTCGFGCHYALGFCFDDAGNDTYGGTIMGLGFAWDCSIGYLCDFGGNDRYGATGGLTEGVGAQAGLGVLLDYGGDDAYEGYSQGYPFTYSDCLFYPYPHQLIG